jgi:hypothetical protein
MSGAWTKWRRTYGANAAGDTGTFKSSADAVNFTFWGGNCTTTLNDIRDFALVRLNTSIRLPAYPTVMASTSSALASSKAAFLYSYPAQYGGLPVYSAKNPLGLIRDNPSSNSIEIDLSTDSGSSGSALYLWVGGCSVIAGVMSHRYNNACPNSFAVFRSDKTVQSLLASLGY